jgi:hypothetical protein
MTFSPKAIEAALDAFNGCKSSNDIDAMQAAFSAALAVDGVALQGWQPIESAPMDGTEIIGVYFRPEDGMFKETIYGPWTIAFERGKWRSSWDRSEVVSYMSDFGTEYKEPDIDPTHWMPLPAPPAASDREERR